ncbi:MAG: RelA/SpoT family protein [Desulfomonilaceae bacterium]
MNDLKTKQIVRFGEIQDLIKSYYPDADLDLLRHAYIFSAQVHQGQTRRSGEPYLVHPVAVAGILATMRLDEASVATGLLHDTVEDTLATVEQLEEIFGKEIALLVDGVTKISKIEFQSREERQAENFRKMILAMSRDIRVLLVKLADRLHNMRTLHYMPPEAQKRIASETMEIYAPLAARLGIYWMWTELEDLSFRYIDPERYNYIKDRLQETLKQREGYVNNVLQIIREKLAQYNIAAVTKGRNKEIYSIHRKMLAQNLDFDQIHDLTAFRIILNSVNECYAVLGLIHSLWRPVPGRFKDYIAMPKGNGYQSLHTTVIGPEGARIEIQIRTHEMDLIAEEGIAAHWSYKEGKAVEAEDAKVVNWLRQMMEWQQDLEDPREFFENVRVDLYPDEVYVFTPKGEVKEFPKGATPLDFAYSIHTEVGHRCTGARVNGKMVPLKYQLNTGDTVEIITSVHQRPSKDWLKFVKTGRARAKIRHYVLAEERERSIEIGRESVDRELKKWKIDLNRAEKEGEILKLANELSFKTEVDFYAAIGYGRVSPKIVVTKLVPAHEREKAKSVASPEVIVPRKRADRKSGVKVQGLLDVMVNFARCCNPLPGDAIRGYVTRGRGVTVHKEDCENLKLADRKRIVDVSWDDEQPVTRTVGLTVEAENRTGLLAAISGVFSSNDSDIMQANVKTVNDTRALGVFQISVRNLEHLTRIINALRGLKGVTRVERMGKV